MLLAVLMLILIFFSACSSSGNGFYQVNRGGDGKGNYLAGGMLLGHAGAIIECKHERALACMYTNKLVPWNDIYIEQFYLVINNDLSRDKFSEYQLRVIIHEACHFVVGVNNLERDPCHDEDGGVIN